MKQLYLFANMTTQTFSSKDIIVSDNLDLLVNNQQVPTDSMILLVCRAGQLRIEINQMSYDIKENDLLGADKRKFAVAKGRETRYSLSRTEAYPRGRRGRFAKPLDREYLVRGFESLCLRQ